MPAVEWGIEASQRIAQLVVTEGFRVLAALFGCLAECELQVCRRGASGIGACQLRCHRGNVCIAEVIVLEIGEAPPGLGAARVHAQCRLVGGFALFAPPERFLHMADGHAQLHFSGAELRRVFVGFECRLLAQQAHGHRGERDPALRVLGLDLQEPAYRGVGFLELSQRHQHLPQSAPDQWMVGRLPERMAQQALCIAAPVGGERERRQAAQCRHVRRIGVQDLAKQLLGALAIVGEQRRGGSGDS